ncbi:nucleoside triphosphate pyrophosphohydrolase [Desulfonema magnum]|uniref:Nucleoside triphosphate pyrophosphohydrolase n=1 Tax=Desulfonema magnum TaxID=45655 RepID=A0A975BLL6_9BACT|nr:nucleoside triphosphate pyrophosphohydrolase [Desulfonema magnum]QTA87650.1 Nucleoside triphosphate pyrophosphohydrolase [Desulfonema magnum]
MSVKNIEALIELIATLRGENGCPWDRKQIPKTMGVYLLEETYELLEAIQSGRPDEVREELGDVFFHILFIARLYEEKGHFDIGNVTRGITDKMIHRHPHVFGNETVSSEEEIRENWRKIKKREKNHFRQTSVLDSVPVHLPALMRAYRISERAAGTGFDWEDISGVMEKVEEEWAEFKSELKQGTASETKKNDIALELGDLLFTLVNVARFIRIHPDTALTDAIKKFETRFKYMEKTISDSGRDINTVSQNEMNELWEKAKKIEN